jgi:hypothetical protein
MLSKSRNCNDDRSGRQGVAMDSLEFQPAGPSMPCGRNTPETALLQFEGQPTHRVSNRRPSSTPLDIPCRTPMNHAAEIRESLNQFA